MNPKFSTYLDFVRFTAALTVFLGHASGKLWTGSFLWPLGQFGDTCVVVFFVLSGFVIAYVCDVKERTWQVYCANRVARLWSVVLPALLLTLLIDFAGVRIAPQLYLDQPWYGGDHVGLRYLASTFMLQEIWHIKYVPGINQPFWSLSYEAFYYLLFGLTLFLKSPIKWVLMLIILAIAGPLIAALFPIWIIGYGIYHFTKRYTPSIAVSVVLFLVGLAMLIFSPTLRAALPIKWHVLGESTVERYIDAVGFVLNLLGAHGLSHLRFELPAKMRNLIATVASTTFVRVYSAISY
jgi:peptidoglycan/LPS O-acetylase OafA/YrhL